MKFSIRQSSLVQMIQTVSKAVAVRTTKQVLTGILLQAKDNMLIATAYDLELGIQDTLVTDEDNHLQIEQAGSIVLPARYFSDVIKKLPEQQVHFRVENNYMTSIQSGQAEFHLHGIDAAEFPKLPVFQGARSLSLPSNELKDLIQTTVFAAATSEVRPILTGTNVQFHQSVLTFTATDGLRLATKHTNFTDDEQQLHAWNAIIPSKSLLELSKILPDDERPITIQLTDSHSLFVVDNTYFYTRLIEGSYPDTSRIIPSGYKTEVTLDAAQWMDAVDRAALIVRDRDNHMIRLELKGQELIVTANSPDIGNASESIEMTEKSGDDLVISFNAKYVIDALKATEGKEVVVQFNGGNQPFTIRKRNDDHGLQLISPVLMR